MNSIKDEALKLIQGLPDDCTLEDIRYRIYLLTSLTEGMRDIEEGRVFPQDEAERRMKEWLASYGQPQA